MGLEEVELDIKRKIDSRVESILVRARKEAETIVAEARESVKQMRVQRRNEAMRMAEEFKKREIASAKLEARKLVLDTKKELIESAFAQALESFKNMSHSEKKEMLKALLGKARAELRGAKYFYCNQSDEEIVRELAKMHGLVFGGAVNCSGGFILESTDRTVRVDYTIDTILERVKREKLQEVAQRVFAKR